MFYPGSRISYQGDAAPSRLQWRAQMDDLGYLGWEKLETWGETRWDYRWDYKWIPLDSMAGLRQLANERTMMTMEDHGFCVHPWDGVSASPGHGSGFKAKLSEKLMVFSRARRGIFLQCVPPVQRNCIIQVPCATCIPGVSYIDLKDENATEISTKRWEWSVVFKDFLPNNFSSFLLAQTVRLIFWSCLI